MAGKSDSLVGPIHLAPKPDFKTVTLKSYCDNGELVNDMSFVLSDGMALTIPTRYSTNENGDLVIKSSYLQEVEVTTCKKI